MNNAASAASAALSHSRLYSTDSLHFSAWIICDNLLPYDHSGKVGRKIWFFFQDPENRGPALRSQWQTSDPLVPQKTINEVVRMLRTEMTALQMGNGVRS